MTTRVTLLKKPKLLYQAFFITFMIGLVLGGWFFYSHKSMTLNTPQDITLSPGQSVRHFAQQLESQGVIHSAFTFELTARSLGISGSFQAGTYRFTGDISSLDIMHAVQKGKTYNPLTLKITFPEGSNLKEVSTILWRHRLISKNSLWKGFKDTRWLRSLNIHTRTPEGYIYPSTYMFYGKKPSAKAVIKRAVQEFFNTLPKNYEEQVQANGLSLHDAITFASLIEKETALTKEMPLVSEVIWARLKNKEALGIDAALIYGIKNYKGNITWKHLRDRKNPYNTRIHKGLPPTPIASPSIQALGAVLTPSAKGYYFYVLKPNSKEHHFSKTAKEHQKHVRYLVQASRQQKGKQHAKEKSKNKDSKH
ncbi:MAG: endolytic transglycosylase MltG [Oligoflexales bacterium]